MMKEGYLAVVAALSCYICAYRDLDYKVIKEQRTLIKAAGVPSYHVLGYLDSVSTAYVLTPHDWRSLMKIILFVTQFAFWLMDYHKLCTAQARVLQDRVLPVVIVQLTGEGLYAAPAVQTGNPRDVYDIITCLALQALWQLLEVCINANVSFAKILQGPANASSYLLAGPSPGYRH